MLTFPTQAEQAIAQWQAATKTVSFNVVAKRFKAFQEKEFGFSVWIFPDDSSVKVSGRGRNHKLQAQLP